MAFDLWAGYNPAHYALASGLFDSLGVRVTLTVPENTRATLADFSAGRYDLIPASVTDVVPLLQNEPDLRIVFCTDESAGADAVVGRPTVRTVAELRGKRIGVKFGGFAEMLVRRMLDRERIPIENVELIDIDAAGVPEALKSGRIDAGETWEPYLGELRRAGFPELMSSAAMPGLIVECIFAHHDVATRREPELRRLADAWFIAQRRLRESPEAGLALVAKALDKPSNTLSLAGVRFLDRDENRRRFSATDSTSFRTTFMEYEHFFGSMGLLRAPIDKARLLDDRFIP